MQTILQGEEINRVESVRLQANYYIFCVLHAHDRLFSFIGMSCMTANLASTCLYQRHLFFRAPRVFSHPDQKIGRNPCGCLLFEGRCETGCLSIGIEFVVTT